MGEVVEGFPSFEEFKVKRREWFERLSCMDVMGGRRGVAAKLVKARFSKNPYYKIFKSIFSDTDEEVYAKCLSDPLYKRICLEELGLK